MAFGRLLQNINIQGVKYFFRILLRDPRLAVPHMHVKSIAQIDWSRLHEKGFKGVLFDVDNTITYPYQIKPASAAIAASLDDCKSIFKDNVAVYSNSAGLKQYDPKGEKAAKVEKGLGVKVLKHTKKKPEIELELLFGQYSCSPDCLVVVGDRVLTDIIYGNSMGAATVLTAPLSPRDDPFSVKLIRPLELLLLELRRKRGHQAPKHALL